MPLSQYCHMTACMPPNVSCCTEVVQAVKVDCKVSPF